MGNVAVARAAIESGVGGVFSYPGTPSTEISEVFNYVNSFQNDMTSREKFPELTCQPVYFEYSINEKIALEKAIAFSIGNRSAMCVMKNVGLNVASDPLMTITYQTIGAPLVIIVCDDPGCFSSSNEQDSRYWGKMASVPLFNPATPEDAYRMTKDAFVLSGHLKLPVIVRMTTRVNHSRGVISYGKIQSKGGGESGFQRLPQHINIPARTAAAHDKLLSKLNDDVFKNFYKNHCRTSSVDIPDRSNGESAGIIASGVAGTFAAELLNRNDEAGKMPLLKIGLLYPFPEETVLEFLKKDFSKILILEELDPLVENEVRITAQKNNIHVEISGKGFCGLSRTGEYSLDIVRAAIEKFIGFKLNSGNRESIKGAEQFTEALPVRPPVLCAGCPHRATFYALKLAVPRDNGKIILCGDIGCFGLGALPPLGMMDTIHHMGMSVSLAQGLSAAANENTGNGKMVALVGDGTFFHSGVASLLNAVYTKSDITLIIFDNRTIGMTGHQDHPGAIHNEKYNQVDIMSLVKGMGVQSVATVDPFDIKTTYSNIKKAIDFKGVSVLIAKSPCIFLPELKGITATRKSIYVDHSLCNTCMNHCDLSVWCSKEATAKNNLARARAKIEAGVHIPGTEQLCPANICNHGFFNSILAGNYKEALEMVRDKMLFAKVCGDICHKPCESLFSERKAGGGLVPIKALKHFVADIEENFSEFSRQISSAKNAIKKNKKIAVIGAGPAGLSAAYDLVQCGYDVTVFEKEKSAGGLLTYGIPDFRMDKEGCKEEIDVLKEMGVRFSFGKALGKNILIKKLAADFDAVIIAVGMGNPATLDIVEKNVAAEKKCDAVQFLKEYNTKTLKLKSPAAILVIGGGNSAMDAARSAKKLNKSNKVLVSCIEKYETMPAFAEEIENAEKEGVEIYDNSFISECITEKNGKTKLTLKTFSGKRKICTIHADYIISAIGQKGDSSILDNGFEFDGERRIKINKSGSYGKFKNIFVAGDIASGNHISVIGAIGSGKKTAVQVRKLLENYQYDYEGEFALKQLSMESGNSQLHHAGKKDSTTFPMRRAGDELHFYDLFQACAKCDHCIENFGCPAMIKVNGKIIIDENRCTRCGLCMDVCPNDAIKWAIYGD